MTKTLKQIAPDIWTAPHPLTVGGLLRLNTRMTVCRLSDGALALHSPIPCSDSLKAEIDAKGEVRTLIAPSLLHHLFVGQWQEAYPQAESYGPRGLSKKRPDLKLTGALDAAFDERFKDELCRFPLEGMPIARESTFFHKASKTLIVTDLCFFMPEAKGLTRLYATMMGFKNSPHSPLMFRLAIKDKPRFRASLKPLRALDIEHLSMCHHRVVSKDAHAALTQVLDFYHV